MGRMHWIVAFVRHCHLGSFSGITGSRKIRRNSSVVIARRFARASIKLTGRGVTTMTATVEYKEYRIETEEKDGEWFATIGRLDGLEVRSKAGRYRLYRTRTGTLTKDEALDLARDLIDGRSVA